VSRKEIDRWSLLNANIMKIGFVCLAIPGHFNPMSEVARQLRARNHAVVLLSLPRIESAARAANLPFIPFGEKDNESNQQSKLG